MVSTVGDAGEAVAPTAEIKQDDTSDARPAPQDPPQAMDVEETGKTDEISVAAPQSSSELEGKPAAEPSDAMDVDTETSAHFEPAPITTAQASSAPITADPTNSSAQTRSSMQIPLKPEPSSTTAIVPLPQSNLEKFYAPYLLPEDTSLQDARSRLRYALEQTRILREAFTEQVHERYGVVLKPVPSAKQHGDQLDKLCASPHDAVIQLAAVEREKKKERERAKLEDGENDPLATFGGDGLHLVILPEEQPTLYKKGHAVSAASAAASDGLLDRVRLIRGLPVVIDERRTPRVVDRSLNSSPSLSVESSNLMVAPQIQQTVLQKPRKSGYSSMLTLTPEGETLLKNKKYNATQMALLARGVGVAEMKRDPRLSSLVHHQRVVPKEFYETVLPPLLGARQVGRMEVRKVQARKAIRSVIREIMEKEEEDELVLGKVKSDGAGLKKSGDNDKDGSGGSSSELGLLHRLHSISEKQNESKDSSDQAKSAEGGGKSGESTANLAIDPVLAYSVMSAVGLVNAKKDEDEDEIQPGDKKDSGNSIAKTLGLSKLMNLGPVSDFVKSFNPIAKGTKRKQANDEDDQNAKKAKVDTTATQGSDEVLHIRGGGGDEGKEKSDDKKKESSRSARAVAAPANVNLTSTLQNHLLQHQSLYNMNAAMGGSIQSPLDAYQNAALAHQLGISYPIGAHATSDLSEYILRSQSDRGLLPGQLNYDPLRDLLLREQQAAVQYQAALSSLATQNHQYAAFASMHSSNESDVGTSSSKAIDLDPAQSPQRKRSKSMEDNKTSPKKGRKKGKSKATSPVTRPSSAPVQPARIVLPKAASKAPPLLPHVSEVKETTPEIHFTPPEPPKGLNSEVAQLILDAKFHEAHALSQRSDDKLSVDLLIEFLLSLSSAIPISEATISEMLVKKLAKRPVLKEFASESSFASDARKVVVATITICLWTKNESFYKQSCVDTQGLKTSNLKSNAVISFAVEKALHALSVHCESQSSMTSNMQKAEIASIVNKSLARKVQLNKQMDATLPIMDDMLGLLDSLRVEALKAKVQERVLLATLVSTHGKMSEAFSNAYVSAIIRAGEALGHEDVCEIAQDETCRASTMLPYDFFHDHTGLWEEPCRPQLGVHPDSTGKELKRRAHAKSLIQKSMKKLQDCLGLEGGIADGGPYFSTAPTGAAASSSPSGTPMAKEAVLIRTNSSSLKRKGSQNWDTTVMPGTGIVGVPDSIFNPGHWVEPMQWDSNSMENTPYGRHPVGLRPSIYSVGGSLSESKWKKLKQFPAALQNRSTHEVKWEDVASMFLHGGSTRNIVLDLGGDSGTKKKNIVAPFVRPFDINSLNVEGEDDEEFSDEDISDETVLKRHQDVLDNMSKKITALTDKQTQPRGRKKQA